MSKEKKVKKGVSWVYAVLTVVIISAFIVLMVKVKQPAVVTPVSEVEENVSSGVQFGDMISINFVLALENGSVVDTNNAELAQKSGIANYVKGPYTFILGQSGKVPGFDEAIRGKSEGAHIELVIEPSEKEVVLAVNKTKAQRRHVTISKLQAFPVNSFEAFFGKKPVEGDIVFSDKFAFKYQVINFTNKTVMTEMVVKEGEKYTLPNTEWESAIVRIADNDVMFYQMPSENQVLVTPFGNATINFTQSMMFINFQPELNKIFNKSVEIGPGYSIPQSFQVIDIKDDHFVIKRYGLLSDKKLLLTADILSVTAGVKEVREDKKIMSETVSS